jgi:hypothetical protein
MRGVRSATRAARQATGRVLGVRFAPDLVADAHLDADFGWNTLAGGESTLCLVPVHPPKRCGFTVRCKSEGCRVGCRVG